MPNMLIIDDNVEFKTMVAYFFTNLKYKVELADNGREGLRKARTFKPDIILLDVMMPDIGGIEVLRELQTYDEARSVPVIILTGTYFDKNMSELFKQESNCRDFLSKTIELSYLEKRIGALLKKP
ncbi:MAG: response regulator [Elusimicrobiales bacterium]|jgi:DNA-binding response OmpR family regulator